MATYFFVTIIYPLLFLLALYGFVWLLIKLLFWNTRLTKRVIYIVLLLTAMYSVRANQVRSVNKEQLVIRSARGW